MESYSKCTEQRWPERCPVSWGRESWGEGPPWDDDDKDDDENDAEEEEEEEEKAKDDDDDIYDVKHGDLSPRGRWDLPDDQVLTRHLRNRSLRIIHQFIIGDF